MSHCPRAAARAAMTEEEFWQDVARNLGSGAPPDVDPGEDDDPPDPSPFDAQPCTECGEVGACGYDSEGRPMVHVVRNEDE